MESFFLFIHLAACLGIIGLVLLQQGKGADAGASFGAGSASDTVFGSQGAGNFLSRSTAIFATLFFITSLGLHHVIAARSLKEQQTKSILNESNSTPPAQNLPN